MIVTSIGERCFLQNWLWKQHQNGVIEYHENMLSRLQEYPYPSDDPKNLTPYRLSRYDDFCKSFSETCKMQDISGHKWLVSEEEKCMTHYLNNIDFNARTECLKQADVILYYHRVKEPEKSSEQLAQEMFEGIGKVNSNNATFVMISPFVEKSSSIKGCYVLKSEECPYWDLANWEKANEKEVPDPEYSYLKGWHVTANDAKLLERVLNAVK